MPIYVYRNPETGEELEVFQSMTEKHEYLVNGNRWERVFYAPNASIDTEINPMNAAEFSEKVGRKKGNMGDLFDLSKELGKKRAAKLGYDPIAQKKYDAYEKKYGRPHKDLREKKLKENLNKLGVDLVD